MENSCIVMCPCCGQFIEVVNSIFGARAYPFYKNPCDVINAIKQEDNSNVQS